MAPKPKVLLVDDEEAIRFGFTKYLSKKGYDLEAASDLAEAKGKFSSGRFDAILLDLTLPDGNGVDWISELRAARADLAIVVITGTGDVPVAVDAMRRGADNLLTKPVDMADLDVYLQKSLELEGLRRRDRIRNRLAKKGEPCFGSSASMEEVVGLATTAGESDSAVMIEGETGTGKGVLARWIHDQSARSSAPFVEVNCSSLRGELLASELFGHAKGAFTSAVEDREGLVEVAHGGTLFLDEIGDMDVAVQAQFLKVIEEKQYRRLGEVKVRRSEFRLICATNHDLDKQVEEGTFRKDLYFRINVFPIQLPPLRERAEDIAELVEYTVKDLGRGDVEVSGELMKLLEGYAWPGNIRELRNVLERAILLARGNPLGAEHFPGLGGGGSVKAPGGDTWDLDGLENEHITRALDKFGGDVREAAKALGISRATLYRKLKKIRGE
jgi:DNA-binding NtrC family response regulator